MRLAIGLCLLVPQHIILQSPLQQPNATERWLSLAEVFVNKALLSNRTPGTLQVSLMMKNKGATVFIAHFLLESL